MVEKSTERESKAENTKGDFLIRKSTFIVKNNRSLQDVYILDSENVSKPNWTNICLFRVSVKVLTVKLKLSGIETPTKNGLWRLLLGQRSRIGTASLLKLRSCRHWITLTCSNFSSTLKMRKTSTWWLRYAEAENYSTASFNRNTFLKNKQPWFSNKFLWHWTTAILWISCIEIWNLRISCLSLRITKMTWE